jgi:hypothetical protein
MTARPNTAKKPTDRKPPANKAAPARKPTAARAPAKKAPAARKPRTAPAQKAEAAAEPTTLIVPLDGVDYHLDPDVFNDVEILELLGEIQSNEQVYLLPSVMKRMLGDEQFGSWKDAHRLPTGRVPLEPMMSFLDQLFEVLSSGNYFASPSS